MRPTSPVLGAHRVLRLLAVLLAAAVALASVGLRHEPGLLYGAAGVVVLGALATRWPGTPLPLAALVGLGVVYAVASEPLGPLGRGVASVLVGGALFCLHEVFALLSVGARRGQLDPAVVRAAARRGALVASGGAAVGAVAVLVGAHAPAWTWLGALGVLAALGLALGPLARLAGEGRRG